MGCEPIKPTTPPQLHDNFHQRRRRSVGLIERINYLMMPKCFQRILIKLEQQHIRLIQSALLQHCILSQLTKFEREKLIECVQVYRVPKDVEIFRRGETLAAFIIIAEGVIGQQKEDKAYQLLQKGESFGESSLIYKSSTSSVFKTFQQCTFFCISRQIFAKALQELSIRNFQFTRDHLLACSFLKPLTLKQKLSLAYKAQVQLFPPDSIICKQGEDASCIYLVIKGHAQVIVSECKKILIPSGDFFGERCIEEGARRKGNAKAGCQGCTIIAVGKRDLKKCVKVNLQSLEYYNILQLAFKKHTILKKLKNSQQLQILQKCSIVFVQSGTILTQQSTLLLHFYVCLSGKINGSGFSSVHNLQEHPFISLQEPKNQQLVMNESGYVAIFSLAELKKVLKQQQSFHTRGLIIQRKFLTEKEVEELKVVFNFSNQFSELLQDLKIFCVQDEKKAKYCLKIIKKSQKVNRIVSQSLKNEQKILKKINNPFVFEMIKLVQDQAQIVLVSIPPPVLSLSTFLENQKTIAPEIAQFYLANLVQLINSMHVKNIIHRCLCPDNIWISEIGYLFASDLLWAKQLQQSQGFRTFTILDPDFFMAPEILACRGYSFGVDIWSLGIIFYQIIFNELPFGSQYQDPYQIFQRIISNDKIPFPENYEDKGALLLLQKLLDKDENKRNLTSCWQIKNMTYFKGVCWQNIERQQQRAPQITIKKNRPSQNQNYIGMYVKDLLKKQIPATVEGVMLINQTQKSKEEDNFWAEFQN